MGWFKNFLSKDPVASEVKDPAPTQAKLNSAWDQYMEPVEKSHAENEKLKFAISEIRKVLNNNSMSPLVVKSLRRVVEVLESK